jgi:hypothetical protein
VEENEIGFRSCWERIQTSFVCEWERVSIGVDIRHAKLHQTNLGATVQSVLMELYQPRLNERSSLGNLTKLKRFVMKTNVVL